MLAFSLSLSRCGAYLKYAKEVVVLIGGNACRSWHHVAREEHPELQAMLDDMLLWPGRSMSIDAERSLL